MVIPVLPSALAAARRGLPLRLRAAQVRDPDDLLPPAPAEPAGLLPALKGQLANSALELGVVRPVRRVGEKPCRRRAVTRLQLAPCLLDRRGDVHALLPRSVSPRMERAPSGRCQISRPPAQERLRTDRRGGSRRPAP